VLDYEATCKLLNDEAKKRDKKDELTLQKADPLLIASRYKDEFVALLCSMYAYGNANSIVKFLSSLDFSLLDKDEDEIRSVLDKYYYRFQSSRDTQEIFVTLGQIKKNTTLENIFMSGYTEKSDVMDGIYRLIEAIYDANPYRSRGYEFLIGKIPKKRPTSPYKRWNMFLRWMVREDNLDLGLWKNVNKKDLLMPLDTHTFKMGQKLGLIQRKTYDFKSVIELTNTLKRFDFNDPVKYDFALYRIGQEGLI
jgi:uncharacterized protein (TIGR02757 family)